MGEEGDWCLLSLVPIVVAINKCDKPRVDIVSSHP